MTNHRSKVVASARSAITWATWWGWADVSRAVSAVMKSGASTRASTVETTSTTPDTVRMDEMERKASRSLRLDSWATKTGMKVAERTPPSTMS